MVLIEFEVGNSIPEVIKIFHEKISYLIFVLK